MLHENVPGHKVSVLAEPLSQAVGAFVQALQLLQLLSGHLCGGKRNMECIRGEALSRRSGGFCPGLALTFLSSRYSMSAVL